MPTDSFTLLRSVVPSLFWQHLGTTKTFFPSYSARLIDETKSSLRQGSISSGLIIFSCNTSGSGSSVGTRWSNVTP